jgi:hypothetical protein
MKKQLTAVEYIKEKLMCDEYWYENLTFEQIFEQAKEMEKEQAELYAEFAVLNDRSENPIIPFNEFINIDNL